jgi:hypothetical protein
VVNRVNCPLACEIPENVELTEVPEPRHYWGDVLRCPNGTEEGLDAPCGRAFLVKEQV